MSKYKGFRLKFSAPLHVNAEGFGYERTEEMIHSDSLFGSLINAWRWLYPEDVSAWFPKGGDDLLYFEPFKISSAFPFKGSVFFFPKPLVSLVKPEGLDPELDKQIKKAKFISQAIFERIINGETIDFSSLYMLQDSKFWLTAEEMKSFHNESSLYCMIENPRVSLDRLTNASLDVFYFAEIHFAEDSGLYFFIQFNDNKKVEKHFSAVLRFLGDEGIGGDRRLGKGLFQTEPFELDLQVPESEQWTTLSLYCPTSSEIQNGLLNDATYDVITRSGWVGSPDGLNLRRKSIRMFLEGSVFSGSASDHYGSMPLVLPVQGGLIEHNVYRSGIAFSMPIAPGKEVI